MTPNELDRYGSLGLCDLPRLLAEVGRRDSYTTVILNGVTVYQSFPIASLCAWRADDVTMIEWGRDVCADVTGTVGDAFPRPIWCMGRSRNASRSMGGGSSGRISTQPSGGSYVIIWEKK
jgi:hypothetical protein